MCLRAPETASEEVNGAEKNELCWKRTDASRLLLLSISQLYGFADSIPEEACFFSYNAIVFHKMTYWDIFSLM